MANAEIVNKNDVPTLICIGHMDKQTVEFEVSVDDLFWVLHRAQHGPEQSQCED